MTKDIPLNLTPDERAAIEYIVRRGVDGYRDTLRDQVAALRDEAMDHNWPDAVVAYQTVLALLDGATR